MQKISIRRAPSVKALTTIKDVTRADALAIRNAWRTIKNRGEARAAIDAILRTHGVEYLGQHKRTCEHIYYCNAGDSYASTVIFAGLSARVACWGDIVERGLIAEGRSYENHRKN